MPGLLARLFGGASHRVDPATAHRMVQEGAVLLDVRTPDEFADGAVPGAINIPVQGLAGRLDELPRGRPIVAYCRSGMRSASAVSVLVKAGFEAHDAGGIRKLLR